MTPDGAIRTDRLTLRPLRAEDAAPVTDGIARWEVMQWLTSPPWPYDLDDAQGFIASPGAHGAMAILDTGTGGAAEGPLIGVIQIAEDNELGYWLHPDAHGRGVMTEAATALVAHHFARSGEALSSGHLPGNGPSARVLEKLGFHYVAPVQRFHRALGRDVEVQRMSLTKSDWDARRAGPCT